MSNNSVDFISTAFNHHLVQVVLNTLLEILPNVSVPCALQTFTYIYLGRCGMTVSGLTSAEL